MFLHGFHAVSDKRFLDNNYEAFFLSSSVQVLPLDVTIPSDSYAWNYREQTTLFTLSKILAEGGFEPLTKGTMHNLTRDLS